MASLSDEESDFESRQRMAKVLLKIIVASFLVAAVIFYLTWRQSSAARQSSPATGDRTPTRGRKPRPSMDPGLRSPLVDLFRRGEAGRDVRMLAAQGILAPRAHEQLALLVLLSDDEDQEIAQLASDTIGELPVEPLRGFLARNDVPSEIRNFFAALGVEPATRRRPMPPSRLIEMPSPGDKAKTDDATRTIRQRRSQADVVAAHRRANEDRDERVARATLAAGARLEPDGVDGRAQQPETDGRRSRVVHQDGQRVGGRPADHRHEPHAG